VLAGFRADLPQLLSGVDVLAHPAAREGLGLALVEAASAGVPAVACAVGGIPDVVVHNETGMLVARDDAAGFRAALAALLDSLSERQRLGAAARRHAERRFDTARLVTEHLSLYTRLLGERAAAPARTVLR
jgi:glycosyltransferase involved in cell wall biosynthesis